MVDFKKTSSFNFHIEMPWENKGNIVLQKQEIICKISYENNFKKDFKSGVSMIKFGCGNASLEINESKTAPISGLISSLLFHDLSSPK